MDECELVTLVTAIACSISKVYSDEEITTLSAVLTQLGDTLNTIQARKAQCENTNEKADNNSEKEDTILS